MTAASTIVLEPARSRSLTRSRNRSCCTTLRRQTPGSPRGRQSGPVSELPVDEECITVPSLVGDVQVRIIRPNGADGMLPVIV